MQELMELLEVNLLYLILSLLVLIILILVFMVIILVKHTKLKKAYNKFMNGTTGNIEDLLEQCINKATEVKEEHILIKDDITKIQNQLVYCTQKIGVIRYNAIQGVGSDLCFAIALLDDKNDGVVINGIYTRDGSYTYAKPVIAGGSKYTLSDEEVEAVNKAKSSKI